MSDTETPVEPIAEAPAVKIAYGGSPDRPTDASLHDIVAWLEAKVAWLEGILNSKL
jgi:hypothetical protein